jgi:spermidine synthase
MKLSLRNFPFAFQLQALFFLSGFSALILEVVYVRLLRYWTGGTAYAVAAVLCAYMAGLALGSYAAGKWLVNWKRLLALYGGFEFLVGLYSGGMPWLMSLVKPVYLALTFHLGPDTHWTLLAHFLAGVVLLLPPTMLMGATFPVVVRAASQGPGDRADLAERLYTANPGGGSVRCALK